MNGFLMEVVSFLSLSFALVRSFYFVEESSTVEIVMTSSTCITCSHILLIRNPSVTVSPLIIIKILLKK